MQLDEIVGLVTVRNYVYNVINNSNFDRAVVNDLSAMLILIDNKIVEIMRTQDFKDYVGFSDAKKTIQDMLAKNNVKSTLK